MGRFDSRQRRQERMIYSVRYFLEYVTVLYFQKVVNIDIFRTELTFKTAIKEALFSGGNHKQLSREENLAKQEFLIDD